MIPAVWGIDTSNYRTSVAIVSLEGEILLNERRLLPVPEGGRGLRQSDAVFMHLKQLSAMEEALRKTAGGDAVPCAVAVSDRPRDGEDSYMPVFQAGVCVASFLAGSSGVPLYRTTHQRGHIAAAARGTPLEGAERFLAVHLSGGTTDLLSVSPEKTERIGGSLDLHAGQMVDRIGVAMGLPFPAGPEMQALAKDGKSQGLFGTSMEDGDLLCHISGAETLAQRMISEGRIAPADLAREVYDFLARSVSRMILAGSRKTGLRSVLVAGGVAASPLLRTMLEERTRKHRDAPELIFGEAELSGDNAVGVALIGRGEYLRELKA